MMNLKRDFTNNRILFKKVLLVITKRKIGSTSFKMVTMDMDWTQGIHLRKKERDLEKKVASVEVSTGNK